jgi:hypothetical protein
METKTYDKMVKGFSGQDNLIWQKFVGLARYRGYKVKDYLVDLMEQEIEKVEKVINK